MALFILVLFSVPIAGLLAIAGAGKLNSAAEELLNRSG